MTFSAQTHKIVNRIFATLTSWRDVVNINTTLSAVRYFARNIIAYIVSKMVHIDFDIGLHLVNSNDQDVGCANFECKVNPHLLNSSTHSASCLMFMCPHSASKSVVFGVDEK